MCFKHAWVETNIPVKSEKKKFKTIYARRRHAIFRKMKGRKCNNKIQELQEQLRKTYDEEKRDEECRAVKCIKNNPKYFYKFVKSHCTKKEEVADLKSKSGHMIHEDEDKANCLRIQYASVFSNPIDDKDIALKDKFTDSEISDFILDEATLISAVKELKQNTSPGPDKFPSILLKQIIHTVSKPLTQILQQTIDLNEILSTVY